jgi:hypothetical protein
MALKAAEGKRNMLSIIDFFIQTLVLQALWWRWGNKQHQQKNTLQVY